MEEIYWITRLDHLKELFILIITISTFVVPISWIYNNITNSEYKSIFTKMFKVSLPSLLISVIGLIFIPSTKEMLLIYGVGGTIDYIKQNETIQQLPDKCVKALNLFIDDYVEEEKDKNKN